MFDSSGENNYNFIVLYNRKYFYHLCVYILQGVLLKQINILGPVVQSIVSLTTSLRRHFVKYMLTTLSNPLLFFVEKM